MFWIFTVLAVLSAIYGAGVMMLRSGSRFFLIWFLLAAYFMALAVSGSFPALLRRILIVLLIAGAAGISVTWGCVLTEFHASGEDGLDAVVVLGAQVRGKEPSAVLRLRLDTACDYLKRNPETVCVVSGGKGANESEPEGKVMREYLIARGIPAERIIAETESRNTVQNLRNSAEKIDPAHDRVGVVTSNFHMFRALGIARKNGYLHAAGIAAPSTASYLPNNMLRESFGIIKDILAGNMITAKVRESEPPGEG